MVEIRMIVQHVSTPGSISLTLPTTSVFTAKCCTPASLQEVLQIFPGYEIEMLTMMAVICFV